MERDLLRILTPVSIPICQNIIRIMWGIKLYAVESYPRQRKVLIQRKEILIRIRRLVKIRGLGRDRMKDGVVHGKQPIPDCFDQLARLMSLVKLMPMRTRMAPCNKQAPSKAVVIFYPPFEQVNGNTLILQVFREAFFCRNGMQMSHFREGIGVIRVGIPIVKDIFPGQFFSQCHRSLLVIIFKYHKVEIVIPRDESTMADGTQQGTILDDIADIVPFEDIFDCDCHLKFDGLQPLQKVIPLRELK